MGLHRLIVSMYVYSTFNFVNKCLKKNLYIYNRKYSVTCEQSFIKCGTYIS